jgi:hypothetical protein
MSSFLQQPSQAKYEITMWLFSGQLKLNPHHCQSHYVCMFCSSFLATVCRQSFAANRSLSTYGPSFGKVDPNDKTMIARIQKQQMQMATKKSYFWLDRWQGLNILYYLLWQWDFVLSNFGPQEKILVDTVSSRSQYAWIDLSAWGRTTRQNRDSVLWWDLTP